ncbi:hypothetical protein ABGV42_01710 [Paenibacillus pabuli]|uniref:hypothetical protein n=1 Tax=Paenibacillus pabuli TaxID=1472 RepID=UPI00324250F0
MDKIIESIKSLFTNPDFVPIMLFLLAFVIFTFKFWGISLSRGISRITGQARTGLERIDSQKLRNQWQLERIGVQQNKYYRVYSLMLSGVIESYGLRNMTVFKFNVLFAMVGVIATAASIWFTENIVLALMIALPTVAAIFAAIVAGSKSRVRALNLNVMTFLDNVCPLMPKGLISAFEDSINVAHPSIRPHIQTTLNKIKVQGVPVRVAMTELAEKLGITFTDFAQKAIIFEEDQQEGAAESFMDITEVNKSTRINMINNEKLFSKVNTDMYGRVGVIAFVCLLANFYGMTSEFMRTTFLGQLTNSLTIFCCILIFVVSQLMQVGMDLSKELRRGDRV